MASSGDAVGSFTAGNDDIADAATSGYTLNHLCLLTHDLVPMTEFYGNVLGMRTLFTYKVHYEMTIVYLGYPHGGSDGNGHQTGGEMLATKGSREGLLELVEVKWQPGGFPSCGKVPNTLSHIGINVPDVLQAEQRLRVMGADIIKPVGEDMRVQQGDVLLNAFGLSADLAKARQTLVGAAALQLDRVLFVADPDGNLVEIQQISS